MKKLISIICVLTMMVGICAVTALSTTAKELVHAETEVKVSEGDEVTYALTLGGVAQPVIGCDFSVYYDSSLFECTSVADFSGSTSEDDWLAVINPNLDGQIRGNWSILRGVDFSDDRQFLTVTLRAKGNGAGHISYFIRYMYDNNIFNSDDKPQITAYKFTCDVLVNGEAVIEDAPPELNVQETQSSGLFVNSVTGDSKDADPDIPGTVVKKPANSGNNTANNSANNGGANNGGANNGVVNNGAADSDNNAAVVSDETTAPLATTAEGYYVLATDADGKVTATADEAPVVDVAGNDNNGGSSTVLWIIIALVVLAGGGAAAYFFTKKKPSDAALDNEKSETADSDDK